jgi:hypothetical protein
MNAPVVGTTAGEIAERHPDIWSAYSALGEATANAGSLRARASPGW